MPRPKKFRRICFDPNFTYFKPAGISKKLLEEIELEKDELEAIRLADLEGLYQEEAAKIMGISRQTFGNILSKAHKKISDFLVNGKVLKIEGGKVFFEQNDSFNFNRKFDKNCQCKRKNNN